MPEGSQTPDQRKEASEGKAKVRRSPTKEGAVRLRHLFSVPGPNGAQLELPADSPHCGQTVH